jgi:hypothetical protein
VLSAQRRTREQHLVVPHFTEETEVARLEGFDVAGGVLVTLRAAFIRLFIATITPLPLAFGEVAIRIAFSRLRAPRN